MTVEEFDIWYDGKVQECINMLPNPLKNTHNEVIFHIGFSELSRAVTEPELLPSNLPLHYHIINFKKAVNSDGKIVWTRS